MAAGPPCTHVPLTHRRPRSSLASSSDSTRAVLHLRGSRWWWGWPCCGIRFAGWWLCGRAECWHSGMRSMAAGLPCVQVPLTQQRPRPSLASSYDSARRLQPRWLAVVPIGLALLRYLLR
eukprot:4038989-Prymnesium_polylepis.1